MFGGLFAGRLSRLIFAFECGERGVFGTFSNVALIAIEPTLAARFRVL